MIDSHLHLAQYEPDEIERWIAAGIEAVVAVATDLRSSYRTLELKERHPHFIHAAIGWHPEQACPAEQDLPELFTLIRTERPRLSAIGEVGLPHYTLAEQGEGALDRYVELLDRFAQAAVESDLPLVLHAVHDQARTALELLQRHRVTKAHFHWLKASAVDLAQIVKAGYYVSVTPEVCHRERDQQLAQAVPIKQLLIETDGPWPYDGPFSGQKTTPLLLPAVLKQVAALKGVSEAFYAEQHRANIGALYGFIT
ncbi:hypothetical protein CBW65_06455 [Tumebacillus avium]|uniref:Uncharacterized protein n=1 Tax=Tumebacillus avium TaxID=1903704 RepID=A0A1Y0IKG7_9BACL|nr:TatD family hydrolase [Tumebacillus avium]ARU60770.1 hypothetical protein CBW65_06455 [Tumebacillus avium]